MENNESQTPAAALTELPPVAKSVFAFCKKCECDRYQTVLAHKSKSTASLQCEVCKAKNTLKLASTGVKRPLAGAAAKRKAESANRVRNAHVAEYSTLSSSHNGDSSDYSMKGKFGANAKLKHPKFGVGFVRAVMADKIEVVFEDEVRMLVHNRS